MEEQFNDPSLDQIESLLAQSAKGLHILFDREKLSQILSEPPSTEDLFKTENMQKIQELFTELVDKRSFMEKQDFLESLDQRSFAMLVHTYFHLVENSLRAVQSYLH